MLKCNRCKFPTNICECEWVEVKEQGSAEINLKLSKGIISVNHTDIDMELASWVAGGNDWNVIWSLIDKLVKKNKGFRYTGKPVITKMEFQGKNLLKN